MTELAAFHRPFHLLAIFAGVWVVGAGWIGRRTASPTAAAVHASAFLTGMVCAFYLTVLAVQSDLRGTLWVFWLAIALTGGPCSAWRAPTTGWATRCSTWRERYSPTAALICCSSTGAPARPVVSRLAPEQLRGLGYRPAPR
ncbi:hypothetical protein [Actinomadura opuntiae]|uniref:hypothetical protein n=1 Tax=Actinomadura sp. OS1-43 TaxID=604315 RepID=UPI00255AA8AC|nr:hypothetical protein [Actinomadura sp. OS1-43]MDL4814341.1 hypothetical protein [Actinomadura sp. OS1-43]